MNFVIFQGGLIFLSFYINNHISKLVEKKIFLEPIISIFLGWMFAFEFVLVWGKRKFKDLDLSDESNPFHLCDIEKEVEIC